MVLPENGSKMYDPTYLFSMEKVWTGSVVPLELVPHEVCAIILSVLKNLLRHLPVLHMSQKSETLCTMIIRAIL